MQDYKIWCTYHKSDIIKEYNLYETNNFKLFYNDNFDLIEDNINYLHDYLAELGTYYYVWKNNLKTDIVGFCSYSKHFKCIDYNLINTLGFQSYWPMYIDSNDLLQDYIMNKNAQFHFMYYNLILYLNYKYHINFFNYMLSHKNMFLSFHNAYLFTWNTFCDICDFVFGYLNFLFPNEMWKLKTNLDLLVKIKGNINLDEVYCKKCWCGRDIAVFFEYIIGIYLGIKYVNDLPNNYNNYISYYTPSYFIVCNDYIDSIDKLNIWIKQNLKSGIIHYVIYSSLQNISIAYDLHLNDYIIILDICNTENQLNEKLHQLYNEGKQSINLCLNEHICCDTSIEMHKGNYYIDTY